MLNLYMFLSVCLSTTYTVKADYGAFYNGYPQSYWSPPSPLPVNTGWNNNNYWGNFQPLWTPPKQYYPPQNNGFNYNSNYNGFNNYNNGNFVSYGPYQGASVEVQNGELFINGKKIPEYVENQGAVVKYGGGILTVNGERKEEFDGIAGTGTINIGSNSMTSSVNNYGNNSGYDYDPDPGNDYGEDSWTDQSYTTPEDYAGNQDQYGNTDQYGNPYNDQQCPGCTLGRLWRGVISNGDISMGTDGIKIGGPNGIEMGIGGIKIGGPHGVKMGNPMRWLY